MSGWFALVAAATGVVTGGAVALAYRAWKQQHSGNDASFWVRQERQWRDD